MALSAAGLVLSVDAGSARAVIVNVGGTNYNVTTFQGTYSGNLSKFNTPGNGGVMPWWGNQTLAQQFATAVGSSFGFPNVEEGNFGPAFAFSTTPPSQVVFFADFGPPYGVGIGSSPQNSTFFYAQVAPAPAPVPGPLPAVGAAAAFGISRRLRHRIKLSQASA